MKRNFVKKACALVMGASIVAAALFADRAPDYISPNNDGIKDALVVPLRIKESRYVSEWTFTIFDAKGNVVRVIGNKEKRDESISFKNFFQQLFSPKQGVEIPSSVTWNGYFDDGSLAPDGVYYYQFSATDDNGNTATTSKLCVIVDNTAPHVDIARLSDSDKTFGEGSKIVLHINQTGSKENLWTATIFDSATREVVRNFKWETSAPLNVEWDGTNESGSLVPDGVYTYEITSTDAAGNKADLSQVTNIIYSAEKPVLSINIDGSKYFSPNGDGVNDTVKFAVNIPLPASKANALVSWKVEVFGADGKSCRVYSGENNPPSVIEFDGKNASGALVSKTTGQYFARVSARYLNGFESTPVDSPVFVLDNVIPEAQVKASASVFNGKDALEISQKITKIDEEWTGAKNWTGNVLDKNGKIVRSFTFGSTLPQSVSWNGTDISGNLLADATYVYELTAVELSGNVGKYRTQEFVLDTSSTELLLNVSARAFSPRIGKTVVLTPVVKADSGVNTYDLKILDAKGQTVKTYSGSSSMPASFVWKGEKDDGSLAQDGVYSAQLQVKANSGTTAVALSDSITLDTVAPSLELTADYKVFSPDGIGSKQNVPFTVKNSSKETLWTAKITKEGSRTQEAVKTFTWNNGEAKNFVWDGTDESGNKAANGMYTLTLSSTDEAGNTGSFDIKNIQLDTRETKVILTNELTGISPNKDSIKESQKFNVRASLTEGISAWKFVILDEKNNAVKTWTGNSGTALPANFSWSGELDADSSKIADGKFKGSIHIEYEKGNVADAVSSEFICTAIEPQLDVQTVTQQSRVYFSPDNDGIDDELYIRLRRLNTLSDLKNWTFTIYDRNHNEFWKTSGKSTITERIIWDGRGNNGELVQSAEDYSYEFKAEDELGMIGKNLGVIHVDVLVVRDGNRLKMQVPSIIFRSDNADFMVTGDTDSAGRKVTNGITKEQKQNNEQILRRIAEVLDKFKDYKVTIVGHANRVTDNPDEERVDNPAQWGPALIPLSYSRAEYVRAILISYGISADRLSVDGKGGTEPVANTKDKAVNWKNRRVEFILEK